MHSCTPTSSTSTQAATVVRILPGDSSLDLMSSTYGTPLSSYEVSTTSSPIPAAAETPNGVTATPREQTPPSTDLINLEDTTTQTNEDEANRLGESPGHSQLATLSGVSLHSSETRPQNPSDGGHVLGLESLTQDHRSEDPSDLLAVPPQVGGGLKSSSGSSNTSLEETDTHTILIQSRSESVEVTEWDVAHSLGLREEDLPTEFSSTLENIGEEEGEREEGEREEGNEGGQKFEQSTGTSGDAITRTSERTQEPVLEDSLNLLTFDTNFPPAQPSSSSATTTDTSAPSGGMDWWSEAFAETQNITEDFDALVEKMEGGTDPDVIPTPAAGALTAASSSHGAGQERKNGGVPGEEEEMTVGISRVFSPSSLKPLHSSTLKAAKSDSSIASPEGSGAKSLDQQPHGQSRSEQSLREAAGDRSKRRGLGLRRLSGQKSQSATSSTESLNSIGGRRKSGVCACLHDFNPTNRQCMACCVTAILSVLRNTTAVPLPGLAVDRWHIHKLSLIWTLLGLNPVSSLARCPSIQGTIWSWDTWSS